MKIISSRETVPKGVQADLLNKCPKTFTFAKGKDLPHESRVNYPSLATPLDLNLKSPISSPNIAVIQAVIPTLDYFPSSIKNW